MRHTLVAATVIFLVSSCSDESEATKTSDFYVENASAHAVSISCSLIQHFRESCQFDEVEPGDIVFIGSFDGGENEGLFPEEVFEFLTLQNQLSLEYSVLDDDWVLGAEDNGDLVYEFRVDDSHF